MYAQHVAWTDHSLMPAPPRSPQLTQHHPTAATLPYGKPASPHDGHCNRSATQVHASTCPTLGGVLHGALLPRPLLTSPLHPRLGSRVPAARVPAPHASGHPPVYPSCSTAKSAREQWDNNVRSCDARGREAYAAGNLDSSRWNLQDNRSSCASGRRSCSYHDGRGISVKHANKVPAKLAAAYVRGRNAKDGDGNRVQYQSVHG